MSGPVSAQDWAEEQGGGNDDEVGEVLEEHLDLTKHESIILVLAPEKE